MSLTPLIIRNVSMVECLKDKKKVELSVCNQCPFCINIDESSMIGRAFCSYTDKNR